MTQSTLPDVQSQSFARLSVPLFAGIDQVKARLSLPGVGECVGSVRLAAKVPEGKRGVHMSRLYREFLKDGSEVVALDSTLPGRVERTAISQESPELSVTVGGEFVIARLSPATGSGGLHPFRLSATALWTEDRLDWKTRLQGVALLGCPCSKALSQEAGFHNQRAVISIEVDGLATDRFQALLDAIDQAASSPVYPVLRREDEKEVIDAIARQDRYRFVEDAGSVLWAELVKAGFEGLSIHVRSLESIHAHDAVAWAGPSGEVLGFTGAI
jgi:GTP cyclohydrolase IB